MPNERLRAALLEKGLTPETLAAEIQVDAKTIERWVTKGRLPYRRHRYAVAARLGMDEGYLWPGALPPEQAIGASESEIVNVFPHRWAVPNDMWRRVFETAEDEIGVLVYSGLFLSEDAGIQRVFRKKADDGVQIRILLGDPTSEHVTRRGADEGVDEAMAAKIKNALVLHKPLRNVEGIEFRLHDTILRKVAGGSMVTNYLDSFERVWESANPLE
jgi:transcriptional regulator with XRE-family HTH domain